MRRCPPAPSTTEIEDIQRLVGNEQLVAHQEQGDGVGRRIKAGVDADEGSSSTASARLGHSSSASRDTRRTSPRRNRNSSRSTRSGRQRLLLEAYRSGQRRCAGSCRPAAQGAVQKAQAAHETAFAAGNRRRWRPTACGQKLQRSGSARASWRPSGSLAPAKPDVSTDEALARHARREAAVRASRPRSTRSPVGSSRPSSGRRGFSNRRCRPVTLERSTLRDCGRGRSLDRSAEGDAAGEDRQDGPVLVN